MSVSTIKQNPTLPVCLPRRERKNDSIPTRLNVFPQVSFGVSDLEGFENIYKAVDIALENGYRSFDCSANFSQEDALGSALEDLLLKHNLQRKDVIIGTKIHPKSYGNESAREAFWRSCENLKTDFIDVYLMQWPGGHNLDYDDEENKFLRKETWEELVKLRFEGLIKRAGVCHFTVRHLEDIRSSTQVNPAVHQVEFHPRCPQIELLEYCKQNNILLQTTSFKNTFHPLVLQDDSVKKVAKLIKKTPTQVVLKWCLNKGVAVVSQSGSAKTIAKNIQLFDFELEETEMGILDSIQIREKYLRNPICVT